jgi:hypothetical protein
MKMRLIQDVVNDILPTPEEVKEAIEYLNRIMPEYKHCISGGAVGTWRMLPDGSTCFYCPLIWLPDLVIAREA